MKKFTLLFITIIFAISANSQITITNSNIYSIGDQSTMKNVFGADDFTPSASGEDIIWDFSEMVEGGGDEIFVYVDKAGLPHAGDMTTAEMAEQLNGETNGYFYFETNSNTDWVRTGWWVSEETTVMWVVHDTPLTLYQYPFTYNDDFSVSNFTATGEYETGGVPDVLTITNGDYDFDCESYGMLILPHKAYQNALRVHVIEDFNLNMFVMGTPIVIPMEDDAYYWFVEGVKGPVMTYVHSTSDASGVGGGIDENYYLRWVREDLTEITADFVASETTGNTDDIFEFINLSEPLNQGSTFLWEYTPSTVTFEDGTDATSTHPKVSFDEPGLYTVSLTVTNDGFTPNTANETKTDYMDIVVAPELEVDFAADNTNPNLNDPVNFTTTVNDETGTTYFWAVSPGNEGTHWGYTNFTTETDKDPQITFYQSDCYAIQLVATNSNYSNSPVTVTKMNFINAGGGCGDAYEVTFTVTDGSDPIDGANVSIDGGYGSGTTNSSGVATIDLYNGDYNYTVSKTGYENATGSFTVADGPESIDVVMTASDIETLSKNNITLYPNPTSGILYMNSDEPVFITVYDISGKQIYISRNKSKTFEIDLSNNSKGLYFINIIKNNKVITEKIILK